MEAIAGHFQIIIWLKTKTMNETLTMEVPQKPLGCIIKVTFFFSLQLKNNQEHRVYKLDKL